ncbi:hypothetical protein J6590_016937 [Homalodisca vitripennis]|nr:hypothetical protein J6590_016937 [Homalodisca vitripennis]
MWGGTRDARQTVARRPGRRRGAQWAFHLVAKRLGHISQHIPQLTGINAVIINSKDDLRHMLAYVRTTITDLLYITCELSVAMFLLSADETSPFRNDKVCRQHEAACWTKDDSCSYRLLPVHIVEVGHTVWPVITVSVIDNLSGGRTVWDRDTSLFGYHKNVTLRYNDLYIHTDCHPVDIFVATARRGCVAQFSRKEHSIVNKAGGGVLLGIWCGRRAASSGPGRQLSPSPMITSLRQLRHHGDVDVSVMRADCNHHCRVPHLVPYRPIIDGPKERNPVMVRNQRFRAKDSATCVQTKRVRDSQRLGSRPTPPDVIPYAEIVPATLTQMTGICITQSSQSGGRSQTQRSVRGALLLKTPCTQIPSAAAYHRMWSQCT